MTINHHIHRWHLMLLRLALALFFLSSEALDLLEIFHGISKDIVSSTMVPTAMPRWPMISVAHALSIQSTQNYGTIVRLAARKFHPQHSKPSSREYTTRKEEWPALNITKQGCEGDYNHYRTVALKNTLDRAVSILTCDVMASLRATYPDYVEQIQAGDLGENILVDGVTFQFFEVGKQYCIDSNFDGGEEAAAANVVLEITERVQPCANLCKLSYINDESMSPKERIERCQDFILHLDQWEGYRGWYAKVISEGLVQKGATVSEFG